MTIKSWDSSTTLHRYKDKIIMARDLTKSKDKTENRHFYAFLIIEVVH